MANAAPGFYRFEAKIISRGGGRGLVASAAYRTGGKSATSAAAYRAGEVLTDERTGETYDYTKKRGIRGAEIMLPAGAPAWMNDRQKLWNAVEAAEKRKDAQTARDYLLSIPHQLAPEERRALVKWFVAQQFVAKGYAADIAFHGPDAREGLNHHAHVMVTMRKVEGDGFARTKDRPPDGVHPQKAWKDDLLKLREAWAVAANRFLEAAGLDIRVTHESLQTRGIDREPDPKLGPVAGQIEAMGRESHAGNDRRDVAERNAERAQLQAAQAQAAAEEARLISLMQQRSQRGIMNEDAAAKAAREIPELVQEAVDQIRAADAAARATILREAELTAQRIEAAKTQAQRDEEKARRDHDQHAEAERVRWRDGKISSAEARYSIALGETAGTDPLGNLVRAAGAESAAFLRNQEALRAQLADPKLSADQKQEIQLRKDIEFYEYNALANTRIGGLYEVIGGNQHLVQGGYRDLLAQEQTEQAQKLRKERGEFLDAQQQRQRDQMAGKLAGLAQTVAKGATNDPVPAPKPRLSEAQQEKLRQLDAADRAQDKMAADRQARVDRDRQTGDRIAEPAARKPQPDRRLREAKEAEDTKRGQAADRKEGAEGEVTDAKQAKLNKLDALDRAYDDHAARKSSERDRGGGRER